MKASRKSRTALAAAACAFVVGSCFNIGCQVNDSGQNLPSAWYLRDDIVYLPKGPENKVFNEATQLKEYHAQNSKK